MGDTSDGQSGAAQRAQLDNTPPSPRKTGFWARLLGRPQGDLPAESTDMEAAEPSADTREMLVNVRNMSDLRVEDVAIPIANIVAVPDDAMLDEVVEAFRLSTYSRLPVYDDTLDNPVGLVHLKDVALKFGFGAQKGFDLSAELRPLLYVPPSMPIGALLQKMQSQRIHMALVIDEYGGVDGLVTIEDLIEQIVGEIADEHDEDEAQLWSEESPSVFLAQASAPLDEFEAAAGVDLLPDDLDEDVETLGGLVFMLSGRVPARGECIRDGHGNEYEVIDADARRIKRLWVRLNGAQGQAAE